MDNFRYPCKECKSRYPGCHAVCKEYELADREVKRMNEERDKDRVFNSYIGDRVAKREHRESRKAK